MSFTPTAQHIAIFTFVKGTPADQGYVLVIKARAGTGKTTTLCKGIVPLIDRSLAVGYFAFNNTAVADVKAKMPDWVTMLTFNSFGFRALNSHFRGYRKLDEDKTRILLEDNLSEDDFRIYSVTVVKLVKLAKSQGIVPSTFKGGCKPLVEDTLANWYALADRYGIDAPFDDDRLMDRAIEIARKTLHAGLMDLSLIDFDDQLYATWALNVPVPRFDWLLVDEAQDQNNVQRAIMKRALKPGGRAIFVGDDRQAIYGFRGADVESIDNIVRDFDAKVLPLSVTFRCPKAVVALARQIVPDYEAHPSAPDGAVLNIPDLDKVAWRPDDLILSRKSAPLIELAYWFIRQKIPCRVAGREIGQGILALVKKLRPSDLPDLMEKLEEYERRERAKLEKTGKENKLQALEDKCSTVRVFAEEATDLTDMTRTIESLFSDKEMGRLTLSTIHKAKGGEAPRVFILNREDMPLQHPKQQPWERVQEMNLVYVALTRAKETLCFIRSPGHKTKGVNAEQKAVV